MFIILDEVGQTWYGIHPVREAIEILEQNPFAPFDTLRIDRTLTDIPYSTEAALQEMQVGREASCGMLASTPFPLLASIYREPNGNVVQCNPDNRYVATVPPESIRNFSIKIAAFLTGLQFICADPDTEHTVYEKNNLIEMPSQMGAFLGWYNVITPAAYSLYYTREAMLQIPTYQVREMNNGWIEIINYPHPLDFTKPDAVQNIVAASTYLRQNRQVRAQ